MRIIVIKCLTIVNSEAVLEGSGCTKKVSVMTFFKVAFVVRGVCGLVDGMLPGMRIRKSSFFNIKCPTCCVVVYMVMFLLDK